VKKLGLNEDHRAYILCPPEKYFKRVHPLPADVVIHEKLSKEIDFIHLL
jgi:hypothetical protein